jgi:hypothetical protein
MTTEAPPQPETQVATDVEADVDEAAKTPRQMFRYSTWVHVGPGAVDCEAINEQAGTNECSNPLHFHAWCRLPNQFQHREIREKALAAKARKTRLLRDPESDAYAILEDSLDQVARRGDDAIPLLVEELVSREWWADYLESARDVQEREEGQDGDGEPLRPFAHVEHDQRRHSELEAMPEEERPGDEFDELGRHLGRYAEALKQRQEEIVQPKRDALTDKGVNGLVDLVRDQRVNAAGTEEFMHTYSTWSWLVGTLRRPGGKTIWPADPQTLVNVAPEVLDEIRVAFEDLEQTQQRGLEGNA